MCWLCDLRQTLPEPEQGPAMEALIDDVMRRRRVDRAGAIDVLQLAAVLVERSEAVH